MDSSTDLAGGLVVLLTAAALLYGPGCSLNRAASPPAAGTAVVPKAESSLEYECERELLHLDELIRSSQTGPDPTGPALTEAVELRRVATDLMLDGDYGLALEMIEEAIALLRNS